MTLFPSSSLCRRFVRAVVLLSLAAGLVLGLAAPTVAHAGGKKLATPPPFLPPYDAIQSIDTAKQTFVIRHVNSKDTRTRTFTVGKFCQIEINGAKGDFSGLSVGMKVAVSPGSDETVADRIVASPAPK